MDELWNDEQVNSICSKELVSLRIDSTTEAFKQFNEYCIIILKNVILINFIFLISFKTR